MGSKKNVMVIGLDGADPRCISEWIDSVPNLARIYDNGQSGRLSSVIPPISASAWTSFATGLNPGRTGVFDFVYRRPDDYKLNVVTANDIRNRTIWGILSSNRVRCGIMNVPVIAYPPQAVNGFMISGMPDPHITAYPPSLSKEVEDMHWVNDLPIVGKTSEEIRHSLLATITRRTEVAKQLIKSYKPDFFMLVFTETDRVQHFLLSRNNEYVKDIYSRCDDSIAEISEIFQPSTTFVLSDHGCVPIKGTFLTNCWLRERGYLTLQKPLTEPCSFEDAPIDWARTKAYSFGEQGKIYINLVGREPKGIVTAQDYDSTVKQIRNDLQAVEIAGAKADVRTWMRHEIYSGPYISNAPDLIFEIENAQYGVKASLGHKSVCEPPRIWSADHSIEGIYAIQGDNFGHKTLDANLLDIAPTILKEYEIAVEALDGGTLGTDHLSGSET